MMENQPQCPSQDSKVTKVRNVKTEEKVIVRIKKEEFPLHISTEPGDTIVRNVKTEEEEVFVKIIEEEIPLQIGADGTYSQNDTEEHAAISPNGEGEDDDLTAETIGDPTTPNPHPELQSADLSSDPSIYGECFPDRSHFMTHHTVYRPPKKTHLCSKCERHFTDKSSLLVHERMHTGEKPYSCSDCEKCFYQKSDLTVHKRVHTGEKPYSCFECGKSFNRKTYLTIHKRVHTGEKPYSCSECEKCFAQKSDLTIHKRIHTGEKPYSCSLCGKCFSQKSNLIKHERVHPLQV